jgi:hypothetical protein
MLVVLLKAQMYFGSLQYFRGFRTMIFEYFEANPAFRSESLLDWSGY